VFGVINSTLRPLLTILTCPLIVVTLGLFTLVLNALMLLATGRLSESWNLGFTVSGFWPAFFGGLVVGLVSMILSLGMGPKEPRVRSDESGVDRPGRL
jgi:putative membrane protein